MLWACMLRPPSPSKPSVEERHRVGRIGEAIEIEIATVALPSASGCLFAKIDRFGLPLLFLVEQRIVKAVVL